MKSQRKIIPSKNILIPDEYQDGECPDSEIILKFIEGKLTGEEKRDIISHASHCKSCRNAIAKGSRFFAEFEQSDKKNIVNSKLIFSAIAAAIVIFFIVTLQIESDRSVTTLKTLAKTEVQRPYNKSQLFPAFGNLRSPEKNAFLDGVESVYLEIEYYRSEQGGELPNRSKTLEKTEFFHELGRFVEISYLSLTTEISEDIDREKLEYLINEQDFSLLPKGVTNSLIIISNTQQSEELINEFEKIRSILTIK